MNLLTLRRLARSKLGDLSSTLPVYSDSDYDTALRHSAYFVQSRLAKVNAVPYTKLVTTDLTANVSDYPLPPDATTPGIRRLYLLSSGVYVPATYRNLEDWEDTVLDAAVASVGEDPTSPSRPGTQYTQDGDYFLIGPTPQSAVPAGLRVRYAAVVTMSDDTSIPQLPLALHDAIWLHTAAKLAPQQDDSFIKTLASQYNEILTTYIDAFKNRFGNEPEQIESVGGVDKVGWADPTPTSVSPTRY